MSEPSERNSQLSEPALMPRLAKRGTGMSERSERNSQLSARICQVTQPRAGRAQRSEAHE